MPERPQFTLCLCPDTYLLRQRVETLLAAHPPAQGGGWQQAVYWGDENLPASLWEDLTLQGLFATPKAIIIRHAENIPAASLRELSAVLVRCASHVWPMVCLEVAFERGAAKVPAHIQKLPCYEKAQKAGWLDQTPGLDERTFPHFIREEGKRLGLQLRQEEIGILTRHLPADATFAGNELAKLALAAGNSGELPPNFTSLLAHTPELSIFEVIRAVQTGGNATPQAWRKILEDQLGGETSVFSFVALLLREGRIFWQILAGENVYLPSSVAMAKKQMAQRLGYAGIAKMWELALTAEKGVKSGERSSEQALEMLVADMFTLFQTQSR